MTPHTPSRDFAPFPCLNFLPSSDLTSSIETRSLSLVTSSPYVTTLTPGPLTCFNFLCFSRYFLWPHFLYLVFTSTFCGIFLLYHIIGVLHVTLLPCRDMTAPRVIPLASLPYCCVSKRTHASLNLSQHLRFSILIEKHCRRQNKKKRYIACLGKQSYTAGARTTRRHFENASLVQQPALRDSSWPQKITHPVHNQI